MGTMLFLTFSVTKRSIYLVPALPAFAIISAMTFKSNTSWVFKFYTRVWSIICVVFLAILTGIPYIIKYLGESVPVKMIDFLGTFGFPNLISGSGLIVCIYFIFKKPKHISNPFNVIIATFALYMGIITGPIHAIDLEKQMISKVQAIASQVPEEKRSHVAGWNFSETMRANFYYYCNWSVPIIKKEDRMRKIINGQDDEFDSIFISHMPDILNMVQSPHQLAAESDIGSFQHKRKIYWVKGRHP
jgi:4-amino-4-deoxy-L-arabinose transferase-like glycosyltransferase